MTLSPNNGATVRNVSATVSGLNPGTTYYFRLRADNNEQLQPQYGKVLSFTTTSSGLCAYQLWAQQNALTGAQSGQMQDFDGDGLANLIEWACILNPKSSSPLPLSPARNGTVWECVYPQSVAATSAGVVMSVEWSDTLLPGDWHSSGVSYAILSDDGVVRQMKAAVSINGISRRFLRLAVSAP